MELGACLPADHTCAKGDDRRVGLSRKPIIDSIPAAATKAMPMFPQQAIMCANEAVGGEAADEGASSQKMGSSVASFRTKKALGRSGDPTGAVAGLAAAVSPMRGYVEAFRGFPAGNG